LPQVLHLTRSAFEFLYQHLAHTALGSLNALNDFKIIPAVCQPYYRTFISAAMNRRCPKRRMVLKIAVP
jgi:hypothetical protein